MENYIKDINFNLNTGGKKKLVNMLETNLIIQKTRLVKPFSSFLDQDKNLF